MSNKKKYNKVINEDDIIVEEEVIKEEEIVEEKIVLTDEELKELQNKENRIKVQAEIDRQEDLRDRFYNKLHDKVSTGNQLGISAIDTYFEQQICYIVEHDLAERRLKEIELKDKEIYDNIQKDKWLGNRRLAYSDISHLLLEAIAEKEAGDDTKMKEYVKLYKQIKLDIPKV